MSRRLRPEEWTAREIAGALDWEAHIRPDGDSIQIRQRARDKDILESLASHWRRKGIPVVVKYVPRAPWMYYLQVGGHRNVRRILEPVAKYLRTKTKREVVERILRMQLRATGRPRHIFPFDLKPKKRRWWEPR